MNYYRSNIIVGSSGKTKQEKQITEPPAKEDESRLVVRTSYNTNYIIRATQAVIHYTIISWVQLYYFYAHSVFL